MEKIQLDIYQAIPCALILNELVCNALKYAFPAERSGAIWLRLHRDADGLTQMVVGDDGVGLPADFDREPAASLGLQLVRTLVRQLRGELVIRRTAGTEYALTFKVANTTNEEEAGP